MPKKKKEKAWASWYDPMFTNKHPKSRLNVNKKEKEVRSQNSVRILVSKRVLQKIERLSIRIQTLQINDLWNHMWLWNFAYYAVTGSLKSFLFIFLLM